VSEAAADLVAGAFPGVTGEQLGSGVGPPAGGGGEDVAAAQGVAEPLEHAEGVGATIEQPVRVGDQPRPDTGGQLEGYFIGVDVPSAFQVAQRV
jgi:hypothetical protein